MIAEGGDLHPTGLPAGDGSHYCADCAWGLEGCCIAATPPGEDGAVHLAPNSIGCALWEAPVECESCGACCREAFDAVPVEPDDVVRALHPDLVLVAEDGWLSLRRVPSPTGHGSRCVNLDGDGGIRAWRCRIYADRPNACRDLARNSTNCRFARSRVGLSSTVRFPLPKP